jgi:hypothetical protein
VPPFELADAVNLNRWLAVLLSRVDE